MSLTIGLVGNPNCGKTTVFNALTGARQKVGNWPGVTVERKSGSFTFQNQTVEVVDLPGTYSLTVVSEASVDERIACDFILNRQADVIVNILDASNLERHLYLTVQLMEMRVPMIVVVNMMDVARLRQMDVSLEMLREKLGCEVVGLEAHKGKGIRELKELVCEAGKDSGGLLKDWIPDKHSVLEKRLREGLGDGMLSGTTRVVEDGMVSGMTCRESGNLLDGSNCHKILAFAGMTGVHSGMSDSWLWVRLLEGDIFARKFVSENTLQRVKELQEKISAEKNEDADILIADARYQFVNEITAQCVTKSSQKFSTWTTRFDRIVLNRVLGIPIFLAVMYCMFLFAINIGGAFQDFFDIGSDTIFVQGLASLLTQLGLPNGLIVMFANGVGKGINTTVTFIPVIGAMFLFLALLEDSGYMARAAFVVDRLMRAMGLPGKSFVPMIVGFGCNVPSVMAARTLENKRDRILTALMSPFMSCGARLAIYAVFTAAFFPVGGQNVVFSLYLIGILMAVLTGFILRKTILRGEPAPLVMELPPYHMPNVKTMLLHAWQRLKAFLFRAGKLILPICVLLGALNALNLDGTLNGGEGDTNSLLSYLGRWMTPVFAPMGIHQDNWPATVGLVTGVLAKEVVVGTLNTLYSQMGHFANGSADVFHFWGGLKDAVMSVPMNLGQLGSSLGNPVLAKAPVHTLSQGVYGLMYQRFDGQMGAIAYLLFVLLYVPCVSTTAAIARELNRGWAIFSALWGTGLAYAIAVGFYQLATVARHPLSSIVWVLGLVGVFALVVIGIRTVSESSRRRYEFA